MIYWWYLLRTGYSALRTRKWVNFARRLTYIMIYGQLSAFVLLNSFHNVCENIFFQLRETSAAKHATCAFYAQCLLSTICWFALRV